MKKLILTRVLVIDDYPGMAAKLAEMVERAGFEAACAVGGREGIAVFEAALAAGSPFSVIITDFSMPEVDGLAVAAAVKTVSPSTATAADRPGRLSTAASARARRLASSAAPAYPSEGGAAAVDGTEAAFW